MDVSLNVGDFAWPTAILILGIVFICKFRGEIADRIRHMREAGREGFRFDKQQEVSESPEASSPESSGGQELLRNLENPTVREVEESIRKQLIEHNVTDSSTRDEILIKYLAAHQVGWYFERVSARIFASQVEALRFINSQPDGVLPDNLRDIYERWISDKATQKGFPPDQWLQYPLSEQLILEDDGRLKITVRGRDFLSYLLHWGHAGPKYL